MRGHFIEYENLESRSIRDVLKTINGIDGIKLSDLRVKDLSYQNGQVVIPGQGVYLFREGKKVVYVGKVSSNSFTERIAKHFDVRNGAWFNRLLQLINWYSLPQQLDCEYYIDASKYAFQHLNLVMINFKSRERINRTESLMRACYRPLNKFKRERHIDLDTLLKEY